MAPIVVTIIFALVKFFFYSLFAKYLNHLYTKQNSIWKVGIVRTLLGIIIGLIFNVLLLNDFKLHIWIDRSPLWGPDTLLYFVIFTSLRVIEWTFIVWLFYDRPLLHFNNLMKAVFLGTIVSYLIDIPVMIGLIVAIVTVI